MAFQSSSWLETSGGDPESSGMSKRLCTGLGNEPRSILQTHWPGNEYPPRPPEETFDVSRYNSHFLDDRAWSASAIELDDGSQQHVGSVGGAPGQTWFRGHQDLSWPSPDQYRQPSCLEIVDSTHQVNNWAPDARVQIHPISNAYDSWDSPSSVINPQPEPSSSHVPYGEDLHDQYHQYNVGTISEHGCEDPMADGTSEGRHDVDTGHEHIGYEVCLGLVGQLFCQTLAVFRPWI